MEGDKVFISKYGSVSIKSSDFKSGLIVNKGLVFSLSQASTLSRQLKKAIRKDVSPLGITECNDGYIVSDDGEPRLYFSKNDKDLMYEVVYDFVKTGHYFIEENSISIDLNGYLVEEGEEALELTKDPVKRLGLGGTIREEIIKADR